MAAATLPSILWLNYSGRKIIQSPLLYKLSLEFYPDMLGRDFSGRNGEFLPLDRFEIVQR